MNAATPDTHHPRVTIVVTRRERLSAMRESLESLYANTSERFELVYVMGAAPRHAKTWLTEQARTRGFRLIETPHPLTPAESRNIGLRVATTEFVVFAENDVVFQSGWLSALLACADETAAEVIAPLTCEGRPIHTIVHHVGTVESNHGAFGGAEYGRRDFTEELFLQGQTVTEAAPLLVRRRTQTVEMHCFMVRRALFERLGEFDPNIVSKEHLDFSWSALESGAVIWVEPKAVVTFLVPSKHDEVRAADLSYFLLRWSRSWQKRSHDALKVKWGLREDGFISSRRALADWRLVHHVATPALERVPVLGKRWGFVTRAANLVNGLLAAMSALLAWRYDRTRRTENAAGNA